MAGVSFVVPGAHPCLAGHFPGNPLVPGVVVVDHVVAALEAAHGPLGALQMPQVKFVQPLRPDERADIEIEALPRENGRRWRARVSREGVLLASIEIVAGAAA